MSICIQFGNGFEDQVATNTGWSDVLDWAESIDLDKAPEFEGLVLDGWAYDLTAVANEIEMLVKENPPQPDVRSILDGMVKLMRENKDCTEIFMRSGEIDDDRDEEVE